MTGRTHNQSVVQPVMKGLLVGLVVLAIGAIIPSIRNRIGNERTTYAKTNGPDSSSQVVQASTLSNEGGKQVFNVQPYPAPELQNVAHWINSAPLTIAGLKGKVILVDFWTFSCSNCQNTQPYLNKWQTAYAAKGLVIIGVHAPEFAYEKVPKNVQDAVKAAKITYPVVLDNDFTTWKAYGNQYWPARYLIDNDGLIRYTHFGEGDYDVTDKNIQTLLNEKN